MLISPTFYEQFFCTKVFCAAFFYYQFGFVNFWQKNIHAKSREKKLMKLAMEENAEILRQGSFYVGKPWRGYQGRAAINAI